MRTRAEGSSTPGMTETSEIGHFYCELDPQLTTPMCGAAKPANETGPDCPLCELIVEQPVVCAFCRQSHVLND